MNDLHEFLRTRRSVRSFAPDPVPQSVLERVLESACYAPSAHNRQPWRFVIVDGSQARERLVRAMETEFYRDLQVDGIPPIEISRRLERSRKRILTAPVAIVLCYDPGDMDVYSDPIRQQHENTMGIQSTTLAGGTLLLAAHAEGLGGVWVCAPLFAAQAVRSSLAISASWQPQALLLLGYPLKQPETPLRRSLESLIYKVFE